MSEIKSTATVSTGSLPETIFFPQLFHVNESMLLGKLKSPSSPQQIDEYLLKKVRDKIGNKCIDVGFVDRDTIRIVSRTMGQVNTSHFNGEIYFNVRCQANICRPVEGTRLTVKIVNKNKIGLLAIQGPLYIYLPSAYLENAEVFDTVQVGSMAVVEIVNYTYQLNDTFIKTVAKYIHSV